ncbi:hypothetical protein LINPERPRIM_LOCUS21967 [Linum perenne]
MLRMVSRSSMS